MESRPLSPSSPSTSYPHSRARATSQSDTTKGVNGASKLSISTGPRARASDGGSGEDYTSGSGSGSRGKSEKSLGDSGRTGPRDVPFTFPESRSTTPTPASRRDSHTGQHESSQDHPSSHSRAYNSNSNSTTSKLTTSSLPAASSFQPQTQGHLQVPSPFPNRRPRAAVHLGRADGERRRSSTSHIPGVSSFVSSHEPAPPERQTDSGGEGISPRWWNGRTTSYSQSPTVPGGFVRAPSPGPLVQGRPVPSQSTSGVFPGPMGGSGSGSGRSSPAFQNSPDSYGYGGKEFDRLDFDARRHPLPSSSTQSQSRPALAHSAPDHNSTAARIGNGGGGAHGRRTDRVSRISEVLEPESPRATTSSSQAPERDRRRISGSRRNGYDFSRDPDEDEESDRHVENKEVWDVFKEIEREKERVIPPPSVAHLLPPLISSITSLSLSLTTRQRSIQHTLQEFRALGDRFRAMDDDVVEGMLKSLGNVSDSVSAGTKIDLEGQAKVGPTGSVPTASIASTDHVAGEPTNAQQNLSSFLVTLSQTRSAVDTLERSLKEKEGVMHGVEDDLGEVVPLILSELDRRIVDRRTSIEQVQAERLRRERIGFLASIVGSILVLLCGLIGMWYTR